MTTPSTWLAKFTANLLTPDLQGNPQIVGLSNGNFLVVWEDSNDTAAAEIGRDIVGVIYDPLGNAISGSLFLNNGFGFSRQEANPTIAARPDGGFVVIYEFHNDTGDNDIILGIYDSTGQRTGQDFIESDSAGSPVSFSKPSVAVATDGSFFVSYQRDDGANQDIVGRKVAADGTVGALVLMREDGNSNGVDLENLADPDTAALANGGFVTTYLDNDDFGGANEATVEVRITSADGTNSTLINNVSTTDGQPDSNPQVAVLSDSRFIVAWQENGDVRARIYTQTGTSSVAEFNITNNAALNFVLLDIVALEDGGYVTLFHDTTEGRMLLVRGKDGAQDGLTIVLDNDADIVTNGSLGLTTDGRILATWSSGEIQSMILDPRGSEIAAKAGGGVTTGRQDGSTITGSSADDIIFAVGGADNVSGLGGNDRIEGGAAGDVLDGGADTDTLVYTTSDAGVLINLATGEASGGHATGDTISNFENVVGSAHADTISGDAANNSIEGGDGNDFLLGGDGDDSLFGGAGADVLFFGGGADLFHGGSGIDYVSYASGAVGAGQNMRIDLADSSLNAGLALGDTFVEVEAFFLSQGDDLFSGDTSNNFIFGQGGVDVIAGGGGGDIIFGEGGNDFIVSGALGDLVSGGTGGDFFFYSINQIEQDQILDFAVGEDKVVFDDVGFNMVFQQVFLGFNFVKTTSGVGFAATASGQAQFIYYTDLGLLYADTDGAGGAAPNLIAQLAGLPDLQASDFAIL